jgi:hypothetical protein
VEKLRLSCARDPYHPIALDNVPSLREAHKTTYPSKGIILCQCFELAPYPCESTRKHTLISAPAIDNATEAYQPLARSSTRACEETSGALALGQISICSLCRRVGAYVD